MIPRRSSSTAVRAKRIDRPVRQMKVTSRTLGTQMDFNMLTGNISRTGLLLSQGKYKHVPFGINTLLELTIDPDGAVFQEPVLCIGKIVRLTTDRGKTTAFGVHIVQMEGRDARTWDIALSGLERQQDALLEAAS